MVGEVTLSPSLTAAAAAGAGGAGAEAVAAAGRAVARMAAAAASAAATAAAGTSAAGAAVARYHAAGEVRPLLEGSEGSQAVGLAPAPAAAQNGDCSRDAGAAAGIEDCFQVAAAVEDAGASAADIAVSLPAPPAGAASHMTAAVAAKMMEHAAAAAVQRGMPAAAVGAPELETDWLASARPACASWASSSLGKQILGVQEYSSSATCAHIRRQTFKTKRRKTPSALDAVKVPQEDDPFCSPSCGTW